MDAFLRHHLNAYRRGELCPFCGAQEGSIACSDPPGRRDRDSNFLCEACGEQWDRDHVETHAADLARHYGANRC